MKMSVKYVYAQNELRMVANVFQRMDLRVLKREFVSAHFSRSSRFA